MTSIEAQTAILRIVKTLEQICEQWPDIRATQLLECARRLPRIIVELPLTALVTDRAVVLYIENLVDEGTLPPWCG